MRWWASHKAWKLHRAIEQESASRKSQNWSKTDATCTISHGGGRSIAPSQIACHCLNFCYGFGHIQVERDYDWAHASFYKLLKTFFPKILLRAILYLNHIPDLEPIFCVQVSAGLLFLDWSGWTPTNDQKIERSNGRCFGWQLVLQESMHVFLKQAFGRPQWLLQTRKCPVFMLATPNKQPKLCQSAAKRVLPLILQS